MIGPTASRIRRSVGHVVDEMERMELERQPLDAVRPRAYGARGRCQSSMAASHWRSRSAIESAGHGYQVKLTAVAARAVARVARHRHDLADAELAGEPDRRADERDVPVADGRDGAATPSS